MIAYASWLISTFYVILALAIVLLIRNRKRLTKADIPTLLLPVLLIIVPIWRSSLYRIAKHFPPFCTALIQAFDPQERNTFT